MATTVEDPADPRLRPFVGLRDVELRRSVEAELGLFVVEGLIAIERLLRSDYRPHSFLLSPTALRRLGPDLPAGGASVYVAEPAVLAAVAGFDLHRGALAAAARRPSPSVEDVVAGAERLLVIEGVNDHENLGGLFRNAAAFGVDGAILDPTSADPLYRRSVRVSMGHVLNVAFTRAASWPDALGSVQAAGVSVIALTSDRSAEPLGRLGPDAGPLAVLVGAEGTGLSPAALERADRRVRIPMAAGVDSLNVSVAAAIALQRVCRSCA